MCVESLMGGGAGGGMFSRVGPLFKKALGDVGIKADPGKVKADAASTGSQEALLRRRRLRVNSLLATGGAGDTDIVTGQPSAIAGKPTLGA